MTTEPRESRLEAEDPLIEVRAREGLRVTWAGVWTNAILSAAKLMGGFLGGSQALIADGLHSLSDLASDAFVLTALRFSGQPADDRHPYGHGRAETAAAFGVGFVLLIAGIFLLIRSAGDLWIPRPYHLNFLALPFIIAAIAAKEALYWLTIRVGRRTHNQALLANAWHHRSDAYSSVAALAGITFALFGYWWADALVASVVAALVIWAGLKIMTDSFDDIMDAAPSEEVREGILAALEGVEGVRNIHRLRIRRLGPHLVVDVHIMVDPEISVAAGHAIAHNGEHAVLGQVDEVSEVNVHVEPA